MLLHQHAECSVFKYRNTFLKPKTYHNILNTFHQIPSFNKLKNSIERMRLVNLKVTVRSVVLETQCPDGLGSSSTGTVSPGQD